MNQLHARVTKKKVVISIELIQILLAVCFLLEKIQVVIFATTSTSTRLVLTCGYRNDNFIILTIIQKNNIMVTLDIIVTCNSTRAVDSLSPLTNYSVFTDKMLQCLLTEFQTDQTGESVVTK